MNVAKPGAPVAHEKSVTSDRKPKPDRQVTSKAPSSTLRARMEERLVAPIRRNAFVARTWFFVTLACVLATHGAILAYMLYRDAKNPPDLAKPQETPVEVVMEQPPPPPPPPQAKAEEKPPQPVIEKPASSAPRDEVTADVKTDKLDTKMEAQKAETPPQDGDPKPDQQAALDDSKADAEQDAQEAADKKEDVLKADAEALDKAAPEPKKEEPPKPPPKPKIAEVKKPKPASQRMAGLTDTPDFHFAKKTKKSPVAGGNEDSRYLAIVYGMINRRIHLVGAEGSVTVSFELDNSGNVLAIGLLQPSGDAVADGEVINAIRLASPFPPPPPDRPHSLRATIDFSRHLSER